MPLPPNRKKLLVCGGRNFGEVRDTHGRPRPKRLWAVERRFLDMKLSELNPSIIVQGGATGADHFAARWAVMSGVENRCYAVVESLDGPWPGAGPARNERMLRAELEGLNGVVAFPGDGGTADMVRRAFALAAGVVVDVVDRADVYQGAEYGEYVERSDGTFEKKVLGIGVAPWAKK